MKKVLPLILVLTSCQLVPRGATVYEHCAIFSQEQWEVVALEEPLMEWLISMIHRNTNSKEALNFNGKNITDVWFKNSEGDLKLCRYEPIEDPCSSKSVTLQFKLTEDSYQPEQVMEKVCMVHLYRK